KPTGPRKRGVELRHKAASADPSRRSATNATDHFLDTAEGLLASGKPFKIVLAAPSATGLKAYYPSFLDRIGEPRLTNSVIRPESRSDVPNVLATFDIPSRMGTTLSAVCDELARSNALIAHAATREHRPYDTRGLRNRRTDAVIRLAATKNAYQ